MPLRRDTSRDTRLLRRTSDGWCQHGKRLKVGPEKGRELLLPVYESVSSFPGFLDDFLVFKFRPFENGKVKTGFSLLFGKNKDVPPKCIVIFVLILFSNSLRVRS